MDNLFYSSHIRKLLDENQIQISIILTALHIERDLRVLINFYYRPKDVTPVLSKLNFKQIIDLTRELNLLKRNHWFSYFEQLRTIRNEIAHEFTYWEILSKDEKEIQRAKMICKNNLKFFEIPIPDLKSEINDSVADMVAKLMKDAQREGQVTAYRTEQKCD